ncbi:hypothetical protein Pyn_27676 [Prunus yedoensis var. nudiflora]|uniref:IBB domain-containing protein n=1 Tax=Prunus yedoensis var. nudiflora TaxID=2094558 RepID=A0A314YTV4_PRUYE|nr:hypothetical protein Pyn_27676 [Prunus yedoensis var. nudiflora]
MSATIFQVGSAKGTLKASSNSSVSLGRDTEVVEEHNTVDEIRRREKAARYRQRKGKLRGNEISTQVKKPTPPLRQRQSEVGLVEQGCTII